MTELKFKDIVAQIDNRVCDIFMRGIYTASLVNGLGGLAILFADGRTLSKMNPERAVAHICYEFNVPESFARQAVAQVAGIQLCDCGCGFSQEPHICPADVNDDCELK